MGARDMIKKHLSFRRPVHPGSSGKILTVMSIILRPHGLGMAESDCTLSQQGFA
jgi:hypothetical protein